MKVVKTCTVIIHNPTGYDLLRFLVGLPQPPAASSFLQVYSPAFVDEADDDEAGMVPVALHHTVQRLHAAALGVVRELVPIGNFVPDEDPNFIRCLEVTRVRGLDVAAQQIQSQGSCLLHLVLDVIERGRRIDRLGIEILVERAAQINRLAVQIELSLLRLEGAETEGIVAGVAGAEADAKHVKRRIGRTPQPRVGEISRDLHIRL